jgi:hypothetical protein
LKRLGQAWRAFLRGREFWQPFRTRGSAAGAGIGPQQLYPIADTTAGTWIPVPLWQNVDDQVDIDNIAPTGGDFQLKLQFDAGVDPGVNTGHVLNVRWRRVAGTEVVDVVLYQGAVAIETFLAQAPGAAFATLQLNIAAANAANITDYADLHFGIPAGTAILKGEQIIISGVWLDLP